MNECLPYEYARVVEGTGANQRPGRACRYSMGSSTTNTPYARQNLLESQTAVMHPSAGMLLVELDGTHPLGPI